MKDYNDPETSRMLAIEEIITRVWLERKIQLKNKHIGSTYHQCPECSAPVDKEGQFCAECQPA